MAQFSEKSKEKLVTCHPELQRLFNEVIKYFDCTIICGYRGREEQNAAYVSGKSKARFPYSNHNRIPFSLAVDVAPYYKREPHIDWECRENFCLFAGYVLATAKQLNISIRWGGSWNNSLDKREKNIPDDLPHFEVSL